jgi:hypothetical protein
MAITDAPESFVEMMLRGILGFRTAITRLEGKWKMSQNRDRADRDGVIKGLERRAQGDDLVMAGISSRIKVGVYREGCGLIVLEERSGAWKPHRPFEGPEGEDHCD